jgi:hypothetical protein
MRRLWGGLLLGLGVFLVVLAAMLRFFVADRSIETPIDQYTKTVAPGQGTYLDTRSLSERRADLTATRIVKGDVRASSEDVGVWDVSVAIETGDGALVRASLDRVAFDRKTGESVDCCGAAVDGEPTPHQGVSYKFPFDTGKRDYQFWDVTSRKAYPARYVSQEQLQGLTVYKFLQQVPGQQLRTTEVPGSLVGEAAASFDAPVWYQNTRTVWVEPKTGVIVKGNEQTRTTLRDSRGQDRSVVLDADLTFDDATQRRQADLARDGIRSIDLVRRWLPLGAVLLGLILLAGAVLVLRGGDRGSPPKHAAVEPEPALR